MRPIRLALAIPLILALSAPALAQTAERALSATTLARSPDYGVLDVPALARPASARALVSAERAFAADVAARGIRDGFLAHLAPDAVVLEPDPVEAVPAYEARARKPAILEWGAEHAEIAAGGDLGWTTGRWTHRKDAYSGVVAGGHYVTIWRMGEDGRRRVEFDTGVVHDALPLTASEPAERTLPRGPDGARGASFTRRSLMAAERDFAAAAAEDLVGAYREVGAADLRAYRMGVPAGVGLEKAVDVAEAFGPLEWTLIGARVSADGALGYAYGVARAAGSSTEAGYLRIWRRGPDGGWALALDQSTAMPGSGS